MTTMITVSATHGWPVEVTQVSVETGQAENTEFVAAGEELVFHVYNGLDLHIHEVQAGETQAPRTHAGLPVAGYGDQSDDKVQAVNVNKQIEERLLRRLDDMKDDPDCDPRWLALARTQLEQGFMAMNRSIFRPARIALPGDGQ